MKTRTRVLCTPEVARGFRLAGLEPVEARPGAEGADRLKDLRARPDVGVVLIEESLYDALPEPDLRALEREARPLVVPFPGPVWAPPPSPEAYVVELLRRAIGYRVKLR